MAKILIIDDETRIRRILTVLLQERGYEIADVESGEEALESFDEIRPDVALLDLSLPGMDGLETLRRLREREPRLPVVMMTAYGSIRSAVEAMRLGASDYLAKPFDNEEMLILVSRALENSRLQAEVTELRQELESRYGFTEIIGISPEIQEVFHLMARVAPVDATVLITGESGTGKELIARAIHRRSPRSERPFVPVNCSAIPGALIEEEFFGHERGAFTDARDSHRGSFEQATGGTLFLDEVGELALEAQAKLLRALQEHTIRRIGGSRPIAVDVRVIAATNKDLEAEVAQHTFREDLFWRLNVVNIHVPPLRKRRGDLPLLIDELLKRFNQELGTTVWNIAPDARALLEAYAWPGNVRELENTLCRAMILCNGQTLSVADLPARVRGELGARPGEEEEPLQLAQAVQRATAELEKRLIRERLSQLKGNRTATAESLGISRKTLFNKLRLYGLSDDDR